MAIQQKLWNKGVVNKFATNDQNIIFDVFYDICENLRFHKNTKNAHE